MKIWDANFRIKACKDRVERCASLRLPAPGSESIACRAQYEQYRSRHTTVDWYKSCITQNKEYTIISIP